MSVRSPRTGPSRAAYLLVFVLIYGGIGVLLGLLWLASTGWSA